MAFERKLRGAQRIGAVRAEIARFEQEARALPWGEEFTGRRGFNATFARARGFWTAERTAAWRRLVLDAAAFMSTKIALRELARQPWFPWLTLQPGTLERERERQKLRNADWRRRDGGFYDRRHRPAMTKFAKVLYGPSDPVF